MVVREILKHLQVTVVFVRIFRCDQLSHPCDWIVHLIEAELFERSKVDLHLTHEALYQPALLGTIFVDQDRVQFRLRWRKVNFALTEFLFIDHIATVAQDEVALLDDLAAFFLNDRFPSGIHQHH